MQTDDVMRSFHVPHRDLDQQLACLVLGDAEQARQAADEALLERLAREAALGGVGPLIVDASVRLGGLGALGALAAKLKSAVAIATAHELASQAELLRLLPAFAAAKVRPLLLKGTALAYSLYSDPTMRPRGDTDMLVALQDKLRAQQVLADQGYEPVHAVSGDYVSYQSTWLRTDRMGVEHAVDLHWRVNNSQMLATSLDYSDLVLRAVTLPALGPYAFGLHPVDALLFACVHRAGHAHAPMYVDGEEHDCVDRLIWLYDIHLLVGSLSHADLMGFARIAGEKRISGICLDALRMCHLRFRTSVPEDVIQSLDSNGFIEPSSRLLTKGPFSHALGDFISLGSWSARLSWTKETLFPSSEYLRGKYPQHPGVPIVLLHIRRLATGLWMRGVRASRNVKIRRT